MAKPMSKIAKHRDFLKGRMDPDQVLDWLLAKTILCHEEVDEVKCRLTNSQKNDKLVDFIIEKDEEKEFINALRDAKQQHLANYLLNDGVRSRNISEDWPLEETQIKIINGNCGSLKDLIDMGGGLADSLIAKRVISHRQKDLICSKATTSEKNDAFLDILRRGSMGDYENTVQCLHDSNQDHIAEVLEKGGAVLQVHTELQEPSEEARLAERITNLLLGRPIEESDRIYGMARNKLIAAKVGRSIIFYYYINTLQSWQEMKNTIKAGTLKCNIEELCRRGDSNTNVVIKEIYVQDDDIENVDRYFSSTAMGVNIYRQEQRVCGNKCFLLGIVSAVFLGIAILFAVANLYATLTIPCWTKRVECELAQQKIDIIRQMHNEFTMKFEQLENTTSELLQTVKESPNKDDLINLVLELYDAPNEETRKKITERIRELEKVLLDKKAKQKKAIKNLIQNLINIIGKVSFKITMDIFQLAEDLLNLISGVLSTTAKTEELGGQEGLIRFLPVSVLIELSILEGVQQPYPGLPWPPGEREKYENGLKEKLKALENSMNETILVLIKLIDETEGVNHLLIKILEKFQEEPKEICSKTPHIKDSKTRSYPELGIGMLRLACLLDETIRMTRLLRELNTQATSLKEDVERTVEQVNEFAKRSIPSLLATLLTVTVKQEMSNTLMKPK